MERYATNPVFVAVLQNGPHPSEITTTGTFFLARCDTSARVATRVTLASSAHPPLGIRVVDVPILSVDLTIWCPRHERTCPAIQKRRTHHRSLTRAHTQTPRGQRLIHTGCTSSTAPPQMQATIDCRHMTCQPRTRRWLTAYSTASRAATGRHDLALEA